MSNTTVRKETLDALRVVVARKHGKIRGVLLAEVDQALREHTQRLEAETPIVRVRRARA